MKKGYINGTYTSVYKSNKNFIVTSSQYSTNAIFYILNPTFDISNYLNQIVENQNITNNNYEEVAADTTAVAVDSVAVDTSAYYGH
jgi:hypothetical protein